LSILRLTLNWVIIECIVATNDYLATLAFSQVWRIANQEEMHSKNGRATTMKETAQCIASSMYTPTASIVAFVHPFPVYFTTSSSSADDDERDFGSATGGTRRGLLVSLVLAPVTALLSKARSTAAASCA